MEESKFPVTLNSCLVVTFSQMISFLKDETGGNNDGQLEMGL